MSDAVIISSPHLHNANAVNQVMRQVILALLPGIFLSAWYFGWGVLIQSLIAILFALAVESLMLFLRKKPVKVYLYDGSAVVTALLFSLAISPFTPFWINFLGIAFAIIFAKHCFGGLGYNVFNPAMAGYIFVLLCFPVAMSQWPHVITPEFPHAGLMDTLSIIFLGNDSVPAFDSLSGATALSYMQSRINGMAMMTEIRMSPLFGTIAGKGTEWIAMAWLAGGIWLLIKGIIKWQMSTIFLATIFFTSLVFYWYDNNIFVSPLLTLFASSTLLAAFFIITDPVTASTTPRGKIIYAAGIAILTYLIRTWGAYPDGVAFAVLIMNAAVPLIDSYTRPRVFGENTHAK